MKVNKFTINQASWVDQIGFAASSLCAIHCAVMPFVIMAIPFFAMGFVASIEFEWCTMILAGILGYLGVRHGLRKHGVKHVLTLFAVGFFLLLASRLYQFYEIEVIRNKLFAQTNSFLAPIELSSFTYRYIHSLTHQSLTTSNVVGIVGGLLIASSHFINLYFNWNRNKR